MFKIKRAAVAVLAALSVSSSALSQQAFDSELVEQLLTLAPAERNATIRAMDLQERKGLWMAIKRAQTDQQTDQNERKPGERRYSDDARLVSATKGNASQAKAIGAIVYDDGVGTVSFSGGAIIGNRFNTHTGVPVFQSGNITSVSAVVVPGDVQTETSAIMFINGPQTGGAVRPIFTAAW